MLTEKEVVAPAPSVATDPIFVAIEMSRSKWVVGTHVPTSRKVGIHNVEWGDATALLSLIDRLRSRATDLTGAETVPVLCCYEAGYEGFWLYRRLVAAGLRVLVIDPSRIRCSVPSMSPASSRRTIAGSFGNGRAWFTIALRIPTASGACC